MTTTFADLGLGDEVLRAVTDAGYSTPTPIQEKAIPAVLMNKDILGCAQTGTGKTASFTLPMIDILAHGRSRARMPRSVILEPTRELAAQVAENFETYGKYHKLTMALLIGGVSFGEQDQKLSRGVDVLIATPGRLIDHCERGKIILTDTKILVIDEGDRMLDMGFIPDVEKLVSLMPKMRQTLMFSATMPPEIRKLARQFQDDPKEITVAPPASTADTIEQVLIRTDSRKKRKELLRILEQEKIDNALIFLNRKRDVASLYRSLEQSGYSVGALHGDMDQYKRMEWLEKFRQKEITILVCSDVAARGLDIPSVGHVINYDVPSHAEDYVHRIGRTGRAGRQGKAFMLATDLDEKQITSIEKLIGRKIDLNAAAPSPTPKAEAEESETPKRKTASRRSPKAREEKQPPESSREDGRDAERKSKSEKPSRRKRFANDEVGSVPDTSDLPFGETDLVPAFLRRPGL